MTVSHRPGVADWSLLFYFFLSSSDVDFHGFLSATLESIDYSSAVDSIDHWSSAVEREVVVVMNPSSALALSLSLSLSLSFSLSLSLYLFIVVIVD